MPESGLCRWTANGPCIAGRRTGCRNALSLSDLREKSRFYSDTAIARQAKALFSPCPERYAPVHQPFIRNGLVQGGANCHQFAI